MTSHTEISSIEELKNWLEDFLPMLSDKQLVLLSGNLGAGKTEFVKQIVYLLGGDEASSPTYAFHNSYQIKDKKIEHIDLYRIESEEELESIGFWDLFSAHSGWIFVEWAERVNDEDWPVDWSPIKVTIKKNTEETKRIISIERS